MDIPALISSLLLLFLTGLICLALYKYCYQPYHVYKRFGIPGPTPLPFIGNFHMIRKHGWIHFPAHLFKKYGPVAGVYVGSRPLLAIGDVDILRFMCVENSDLFIDREAVPDFFYQAVGLPPGLLMSRGEEWKQSRLAISPAFSGQNIKMVANCMEGTCKKLSDALKALTSSDKSIHVDKLFGDFVMDCTIAMVFGELHENEKKEKDTLVTSATVLWTTVDENAITLLWFILSHFPWLGTLLGSVMKYSSKGRHFVDMYEACTKLVLEHKKKKSPKTVIRLILESQVKENGHTRKPTIEEIVSHAITFLMAGFETTSVTLGYTAYLLALNPAVQERLHEEIVEYFKSKPGASLCDAAKEIEYAEMVAQESLRLLPPVPGLSRYCSKTVQYKDLTIPEGVTVYAAVYQIHHDPQYWPEPEKFIPERFSQEEKAKRPSNVHTPFGLGPRICIGARFALLEIKMMLIQMLRVVKFVQAPDTQVPLKTFFRFSVSPTNGIYLKVESW